ncbi:MAG: type I-PGING CRISPR-associated protein Cas5p [Stygiobacter sp.]
MEIDIKYLFEPPELTKQVLLTIQPLAPLSMVNSMPGSYYKTEHAPDKYMLCGLFENNLNLHLSEDDRNAIRKKIKNYYKKKYKLNYELINSAVGYKPIINHLFEIESPPNLPDMKFYEDVWTQHLIGSDERHLRGVINNDWRIENDMCGLKGIDNTQERNAYFNSNRDKFPRFYRSPQQREYLITNGEYFFKLNMTASLFTILDFVIKENNVGYLGTSEGWVHISIGELL